jgi:hypothetical protein
MLTPRRELRGKKRRPDPEIYTMSIETNGTRIIKTIYTEVKIGDRLVDAMVDITNQHLLIQPLSSGDITGGDQLISVPFSSARRIEVLPEARHRSWVCFIFKNKPYAISLVGLDTSFNKYFAGIGYEEPASE